MTNTITAPDTDALVATLDRFEHQYGRLLEHFKKFHTAIEGASQWHRWPLKTYAITLESPTRVTAHFSGRALQFDFSARLTDKGESQGIITCTSAVPWTNNERRQMDILEFSPNGNTAYVRSNGAAMSLEYIAVDFVLLCFQMSFSDSTTSEIFVG